MTATLRIRLTIAACLGVLAACGQSSDPDAAGPAPTPAAAVPSTADAQPADEAETTGEGAEPNWG